MRRADSLIRGILIAGLAIAPGSCSDDGSIDAGAGADAGVGTGAAAGEVLWVTPEPPSPFRLTIDGRDVDSMVLGSHVEDEWTDWWAEADLPQSRAHEAATVREFCADPEARFGPLVDDALLLWEAESRWPELDPEELLEFRSGMERSVNAMADRVRERYGEAGFDAHVERRLRIDKILDAFGGEVAEPTEQELVDAYQDLIGGLRPFEGVEVALPTFEELESALREKLHTERRNEAARAWIEARRAGVEASVTLPDGTSLGIPLS